MEPTSSPENVPQSRGVARFWPAHGMPAPGQRTPGADEPEASGPDLTPDRTLPGHQTPGLDLSPGPVLPAQLPGPGLADDTEMATLGGRRGPEALLGSVPGTRPWSVNHGGFPAMDADRTYRNGDSGAANGHASASTTPPTSGSASVSPFPLGRAEAPRPPAGPGDTPPPAWAAPTSSAAGIAVPPLPPAATTPPATPSAPALQTPGLPAAAPPPGLTPAAPTAGLTPAAPAAGLTAAAPPPPGLDVSALPTSPPPLAPVSGAASVPPLVPAPAAPVSGAPVSGGPVADLSRASRRGRADDEAAAPRRRSARLDEADDAGGPGRGDGAGPAGEAGGPAADGRPALRPGDVRETEIAFWDEAGAAHFRAEWHEVKAGFVDDPVTALTRAHDLLTEAVHELTESLLAERDELDPLRHTAAPDTESMRMAMRGYRDFLERILSL
ncbi:hypothetical protein EV385_4891 [Krasilnikovia cinnamomea]|uniref:Uncharacterized protein n=1 Tax=Krasilnikovia cinnamomea TaxID=349313 RepID=A0A4Q7ZPK5_9ACTN|nr:hypothetical protein [Krasilnikovia cinnamomea]RZU53007.1 hypothetical protein EV385_4891 [Krasilnikovia cinnamomea]